MDVTTEDTKRILGGDVNPAGWSNLVVRVPPGKSYLLGYHRRQDRFARNTELTALEKTRKVCMDTLLAEVRAYVDEHG